MSLMIEDIIIIQGEEDVKKDAARSRQLEPLHLTLASPHDLMGVFSAIVLSGAPLMTTGDEQLPESRASLGARCLGTQVPGIREACSL
jgi:hypothetical protein